MSGAAFVPGLHLIIALYFVFNNGNKNVEKKISLALCGRGLNLG